MTNVKHDADCDWASCVTPETLGYLWNQNGGGINLSILKSVMSFLPAFPSAPLPPPLPDIKTANEQIQISENPESSKIKGVLEQCLRIVEDYGSSNNRNWILCDVNLHAKLQGNAPRCGLVALSMAVEMAQRLSKQTAQPSVGSPTLIPYNDFESEMMALLKLAKLKKFTSKGEMFSAKNLGVLAKEFYGLDVRITDCGLDDISGIFNHLSEGNPILVPYDASANHAPCLENGNKSHWAVLTGIFCTFEDNDFNWEHLQEKATVTRLEVNGGKTSIFTLDNATNKLPENCIPSTLYLLARQPKSRHVGVWSWKELKESNANLVEYCPNKESSKDFVLPEGGLREGLCKKILYLKKK
ncbi:UPF0692 protein C19orf54 homolog [Exaiptasia diaphana]|uniref:Actin maturation protease n=1 Tax=Exaiptasia diaphana TaxID=2652724 RepID=A0A913Y2T4_EXADI|nr:UPF0692 protein C19orf54 homolog [Exaiptasia diaphana]KXJ22741.1 UPF0692 protein C19orf54-like [Exaiptasia diaphana]